ncbi:nuclease-related domain-containing DEAD/DEAH box helicase [Frankia sp. Cj3]|uniref:nuclease-related domain-containing DEAD/DEAH box helicase n=1 Tax=Frankia sp. Cj3 TaxID=2880976 RepID=UPI001EF6104C|nr:NERD domain-containing protein/DEAD/DEAH box helicase [Frankia sp. Cj3]
MRMIPDEPSRTPSRAELEVFARIRSITDGRWAFALHSLSLPEHTQKRVGEIDFLLVGPAGIMVLEVKGGTVAQHRGVWESVDIRGLHHRLGESPFRQAQTAMFALERLLGAKTDNSLVRRTVFGWVVVLPNCTFDVDSVEWAPQTIIDSDRIDDLDIALADVATYWQAKPGGRSVLSTEDVNRYLAVLRPDFDRVPTLRQVAKTVEQEFVALTERQYRALDVSNRNSRILYEGGAGTGKTMLALEMCRRHAAAGRRVLFTCRSEILTGFVRNQLAEVEAVARPSARIPNEDDLFDVVVVDEAQDVINLRDLDRLDRVLMGGLNDGRWAMFLDSNNQRGLVGTYDDAAMSRLRSHRPADFELNDNCRNTNEIISATRERTGADVGVSTAGKGPEVELARSDEAGAPSLVANHLDRLVDEGVSPNEIVLLSPSDIDESVFGHLPRRWLNRVDVLDLDRLRKAPPSRTLFARISDFKGLESPFVLLEVPDGLIASQERANLYVGMTRARVGLWVITVASAADSIPAGSKR